MKPFARKEAAERILGEIVLKNSKRSINLLRELTEVETPGCEVHKAHLRGLGTGFVGLQWQLFFNNSIPFNSGPRGRGWYSFLKITKRNEYFLLVRRHMNRVADGLGGKGSHDDNIIAQLF
jgi:hypothetical protein